MSGKWVGRVNSDRVIVLGGGLAGLTASHYANAPLFEADDRVGGVAASDEESGFVFDRGIHILQSRNQVILDLIDELGVELEVQVRNASIYSHGIYTAYPFQVNTARLPLGLRLRCLSGFFRRKGLFSGNDEISNYEDWIYATLGRGFADTFLIPYSEKFWTVHPREMTHEWTGNRVPKPSAWQVLRGALIDRQTKIGTNMTFKYPKGNGGYAAIANALGAKIANLHLSHRATQIDTRNRVIRFSNGHEVGYENLISTIPLPELVRLCMDAPDVVREASQQLRTNSIFVVNIGIDRPDISDKHWVHFPEKDVSFFRISYPCNFTAGVAPAGMSSISAEVAYSPQHPVDKNAIINRVIDDLKRVGAMDGDAPVVMTSTRDVPHAYCIYDQKRKSALKIIREWLSTCNIESAGRYGRWCYFWSDEAMMDGKKVAEKTLKKLKLSG